MHIFAYIYIKKFGFLTHRVPPRGGTKFCRYVPYNHSAYNTPRLPQMVRVVLPAAVLLVLLAVSEATGVRKLASLQVHGYA